MNSIQNKDYLYQVALSLIPKLGPSIYKKIILHCDSAEAFFNLPRGKLERIQGIGPKLLAYRKQRTSYLTEAEKIIDAANQHEIQIHCFMEDNYPGRLKAIPDSPPILFSRGNLSLNPERTVGIVGTRKATKYGKNVTQQITEELSRFQPTIISGLAYGIDVEAHRAAIARNLPTIGVMGSDLNTIYPSIHKKIAEQMKENGGLLTEYKLGTEMSPGNFPQRNRIIAGLADALVVVEAAKKGGALITAEIAYSYNREVFAVPGNLQSKYSEGCNDLIRNMKAGIYMSSKEIVDSLSWNLNSGESLAQQVFPDTSLLDPLETKILERIFDKKEVEVNWLSHDLNLPISTLAVKLLNLEFLGFVKAFPGKKYQWLHNKQ
ncbi:DNA-processing protein DprA [Cyclobacterium qasimii]|uniref:Rossmann fold nucleotide-binding protein Smf possibly involved in DNA uptake n=3 Tax=Bacteroidota TaxID=976 RepID=S7WTH4_9BACT|nr:DNA-processing protein DprA [Cyclobacterium qasimii]EPR67408.1 Rossmann fold nucleotide-binding protein Smf possibly involved in DNA uptake [Cyclobacterium qasimii M12-11B]GEO21825.1 DNA processing protein DprA [Cyclobacterium qasimii]